MNTVGRVRGYVVGNDRIDGETVWKVRVTDSHSDHQDQKLVVASTHGDIALAKGLEVVFLIGVFQGKEGQHHKAIDVTPTAAASPCMFCKSPAEISFEVSVNDFGSAEYVRTCLPHLGQAIAMVHSSRLYKTGRVRAMNYAAADQGWRYVNL